MRSVSLFTVVILIILLATVIAPEVYVPGPLVFMVRENHEKLMYTILAIAIMLLPSIFVIKTGGAGKSKKEPAATAVRPQAEAPGVARCEAEVVAFLGVLQEKGRLVDFLMEEIAAFEDAQVGAAARVIHEGCRSALLEHFDIVPVREEQEGSQVVVPAGFSPDNHQLVGKITGQPPFTGTLVHKGWKTTRVKLPRTLKDQGGRLPAIAPAQVELK